MNQRHFGGGKRDSRRLFTTRSSENVVVTETSYQMLDGFIVLRRGERLTFFKNGDCANFFD